MPFQLIAFDMDDTLVDTFSTSVPNCVAMVNAEYGVPIQVSDWTKPNGYRGKAGQNLLDCIAADYGVRLELQPFLEMRKAYLHKQLLKGMPIAPGADVMLQTLHAQGRALCVCTNSVPERAALTLQHTITATSVRLPDVFKQHVYSAVPHMNAKPAPDVYVHAAQQFQVNPAHALAVEDTPTGIQAAVQAGYTAVGYVGLHDDHDGAEAILTAAGATAVIRHWEQFIPLLATLEG
ncbi:MAG: HAD family phosphatase [Alphaproteobacteria bacterium]